VIRGPFLLFAARFDGGDLFQIRRQIIGRKCLHIHLDQTDKRATEIWLCFAAPVHDHAGGRNNSAVTVHDIDCFLHAAAACHHVFDDDELFAVADLESTSQDQFTLFLFGKDMAFAQGTGHFLPNNDPAKGGGDDSVAIKAAQFIRQHFANARRDIGVLKKERALKILAAMETGTQNKMAVEQRAGFAKQGQ
jgi:hypothetical protein